MRRDRSVPRDRPHVAVILSPMPAPGPCAISAKPSFDVRLEYAPTAQIDETVKYVSFGLKLML
jgi:hypothetical protein